MTCPSSLPHSTIFLPYLLILITTFRFDFILSLLIRKSYPRLAQISIHLHIHSKTLPTLTRKQLHTQTRPASRSKPSSPSKCYQFQTLLMELLSNTTASLITAPSTPTTLPSLASVTGHQMLLQQQQSMWHSTTMQHGASMLTPPATPGTATAALSMPPPPVPPSTTASSTAIERGRPPTPQYRHDYPPPGY